ncbi:intercellular adhesion molecule 5 isoform X2 [Silurus meridionalis]|uniref:Ig-like domain-containing protein n=1 Tax=Silurus meridionalis TaxID=175797 RepID=A0A8T0AFF3_SILME|nr:intercellular adhesion molecule 5 isoform X2 [Silurus meridionalis]KAF7690985.1 hypothetical protein HF521_011282 [Silurus meridionalis]
MLYLIQGTGLVLALITVINAAIAQSNNCSLLVLDPPELVVQYGDPVSVNCHSLTNSDNLSWRVSQEQHVLSSDKQNVTWETENLTDWEIEPVCSMMVDGEECAKSLPVIVYKLPDQVSISVVDHTGPLIGGKKYDLQCDIQNFAPVHVLAVFWYKGGEPVKNRGFGNFSTKTPSNKTVTLRISVGKDEENVQYRCAAKLKLRILSFPMVESNLLQISVHNKPVISCSAWSPMINTSLKSYPYNLSGNPSPNITWYRDKAQLNSDMRLGENDSGQYKIVASNLMGETSCTTNIRVEYAPIFNCSGTYEVKENGIFKDECLAKASPEANITWEKDGKIVNSLHNLTRGDSGSYVIKAMNQHGSAQHNLTVNVLYAPKIEPDKEVVKVKEGSKVFLNCTAEGNPEPELNWSVQSQIKATGRQQTTLTFFQVSLADAGVYTCTATNSLGNDTRKVSLIVEGDNPIKIQPDKLVVEFGALASANCSINSTHLGMGWEASQGVVDMVDNVQSLTWMVESLTHWDIKPFCYVITDPDKQWQLELQVTVYKHPDLVSISTVSHTGPMIEGRQYELQCDVQNVAPVRFLNVNWYKGQQLVHSDSFTDETKTPVNKTMTLQVSTQRGDDGVQYRCEAELKLGPEGPQPPPRGTSDPLSITVHYKPVISCSAWSPMINTPLKSYPYNVLGNPSPNITWYRDEAQLSSDMRLGRNDSGQYTFVASNVIGKSSCTTNITVEYAPIFECPNEYEGRENYISLADCLVMASPKASVTWKKDGIIVSAVHNFTRNDSGSYVLTAMNKHGTAQHDLTVNVLYKPVISCSAWSPMINTSLKSYPYNLSGNPSPNITWYRDEAQLSSDMRLGRNDSGQYTFVASNVMGKSSCTTNITVEYTPIFDCPKEYEGSENYISLAKCLVMASPKASVTWIKDGKIVNAVHNFTRNDSGSYVLTAMNKHGTAQHDLTVNVLYGPEIQLAKTLEVKTGNDVSLNCTAIGNPEPEVRWSFRNQFKTNWSRQAILKITKAESDHRGQYTCTATNKLGSQTATVSLEIKEHQFSTIIIISLIIIIIIIIICIIIYLCIKKRRSGKYDIQPNCAITMSLLNTSK